MWYINLYEKKSCQSITWLNLRHDDLARLVLYDREKVNELLYALVFSIVVFGVLTYGTGGTSRRDMS